MFQPSTSPEGRFSKGWPRASYAITTVVATRISHVTWRRAYIFSSDSVKKGEL